MPAGRPKLRDIGATLPPGWNGQQTLPWARQMQPLADVSASHAEVPTQMDTAPSGRFHQPLAQFHGHGQPSYRPVMMPGGDVTQEQYIGGMLAPMMQLQHPGARFPMMGIGPDGRSMATPPGMMLVPSQAMQPLPMMGAGMYPQHYPAPLGQPPAPLHDPMLSGSVTKTMTAEEQEASFLRQQNTAFRVGSQKLCNSYKHCGAWWNWPRGWQTTVPKKIKSLAVMWIHPRVWNPMRLARQDDLQIDCLCFGLFGLLPDVLVADLNVACKRDLWDMMLDNHHRLMKENPARLNALAGDLSNVVEWALGLGFPKGFIPTMEQMAASEKAKQQEKKKGRFGGKGKKQRSPSPSSSEDATVAVLSPPLKRGRICESLQDAIPLGGTAAQLNIFKRPVRPSVSQSSLSMSPGKVHTYSPTEVGDQEYVGTTVASPPTKLNTKGVSLCPGEPEGANGEISLEGEQACRDGACQQHDGGCPDGGMAHQQLGDTLKKLARDDAARQLVDSEILG